MSSTEPNSITFFRSGSRKPAAGDEFVDLSLQETPYGFIVNEFRGTLRGVGCPGFPRGFSGKNEAMKYLQKRISEIVEEGFTPAKPFPDWSREGED